MIKSIPQRVGTERVLPEALTHDYDLRPVIGKAIHADIDDAVNRVAWCLNNLGLPGASDTGLSKGIGVFFWSSDSTISLEFRSGIASRIVSNVTDASGVQLGAATLGDDPTE